VQCEPTSTVIRLCAEHDRGDSDQRSGHDPLELRLDLDEFAREALEQEAGLLGVTAQELAHFAVLYYLADCDSGRIARRPLPFVPPSESHPLGELLDG
jgi:hypothetical protein